MRSINMRELRDTRRLKELLRAGTTVEIRDRNTVLGHIVPEIATRTEAAYPDFEARSKALFGKRVLSGADLLIEERGRF